VCRLDLIKVKPLIVVLAVTIAGPCALAASAANAQQLVYTPINPAFGGNPFNSTQLEADATAQNPFKATSSNQNLTQAQLFSQQLQSELLSSLADQVAQSIFGPNAQPSGTYSFGGETVSFVRSLGEVTVTITDTGGQTTTITLPTTGTGTGGGGS
jgi:curli production assembly/transport component CsgF